MKRLRFRKPVSLDFDHMRMLHREAIEQLELMRTALEAAEHASDRMRDNLDDMASNHWHAYMDVVHMLCMHDQAMGSTMNKFGLKMRESEDSELDTRQSGLPRILLLLLILALLRRHQRMEHVFGMRSGPMGDYLQESSTMEREHMAELVSMINSMV